jgi:CheY-like chemotaxis protein
MMPPRLLVVEDEPDLAEMLGLMLEGAGYQVAIAGEGRAALRLLREARFDLVVSDMLMPGLDGAGLAAAMRADPALRDVPLVLVSALGESAVPGVPHAAFLRKPFDLVALRATVVRLLAQAAARA